VLTYLLVRPPRPGEPSHDEWARERDEVLEALRTKAKLLERAFKGVEGMTCNQVAGAMYAFPQIALPAGTTDVDWCMALLEETGICVVDGSGFGQAAGTFHFRTTILPPLDEIETVARRIAEFHRAFVERRA
jgi:aspartate/methionine/tyrosine aminotransferase